MAGDLAQRLEDARAEVERLERAAKVATCLEMGHDWQLLGGKSCGCHQDSHCSVMVYLCSRCGDCDYGDNAKAAEHINGCDYRQMILAEEASAPSHPEGEGQS